MKKTLLFTLLLGLSCILMACGSGKEKKEEKKAPVEVSHDSLLAQAEVYCDNNFRVTVANAQFNESDALVLDLEITNRTGEAGKLRIDRMKINDFTYAYTDTIEVDKNASAATTITIDVANVTPYAAADVGTIVPYISTWISNRIGVGTVAADPIKLKDSYEALDVSGYQLVLEENNYQVYYTGLSAAAEEITNSSVDYLVYNGNKKMGEVSLYESSSAAEAAAEADILSGTYAALSLKTGADQSETTSFSSAIEYTNGSSTQKSSISFDVETSKKKDRKSHV